MEHSQDNWREFFAMLEPIQSQCIMAGKKLVTVMGDIRNSDIQVRHHHPDKHLSICHFSHLPDRKCVYTYICVFRLFTIFNSI